MASESRSFETGHAEMIHDAQLDYYGQRLATASSDRTISIFEVTGEKETLLSTLKGHDGPVWQVSWGHPKFGSLLASCSYDGRLVVWKESVLNQWEKVHEYYQPDGASVNSVSWAPHTYGILLAAATATGTVVVLSQSDDVWSAQVLDAHGGSCNSVSWGPDMGSSLTGGGSSQRRFVTGGVDKMVKIWGEDQGGGWVELDVLEAIDWVRDVAWAPSAGLLSNTIAACCSAGNLYIWAEDPKDHKWKLVKKQAFPAKVWRVSWSVMGNILALAQGDNKVALLKQSIDGQWESISTVSEAGQVNQ